MTTRTDTVGYIGDMAIGLAKLARVNGLGTLEFILETAALEAGATGLPSKPVASPPAHEEGQRNGGQRRFMPHGEAETFR